MIEENSLRKIYGEDHALSNRNIDYIFYCNMLVLSKFNNETKIRYLVKEELAGNVYRTENGYKKFRFKIKKLIDNELMYEDKDFIYFSDSKHYFITEKQTLRYLTSASNDEVIRLYVLLGKWFNWSNKKITKELSSDQTTRINQQFRNDYLRSMRLESLAKAIGRASFTRHDKQVIKDQLLMLSNSGLIEIEYVRKNSKTISKNSTSNNSDTFILLNVNLTHKNNIL